MQFWNDLVRLKQHLLLQRPPKNRVGDPILSKVHFKDTSSSCPFFMGGRTQSFQMHKMIKMSFVRIRHSDVPIGRIRQVFSKAAISNLAMTFLLLSLGGSCDLRSSASQSPVKSMESTHQDETSDLVSIWVPFMRVASA